MTFAIITVVGLTSFSLVNYESSITEGKVPTEVKTTLSKEELLDHPAKSLFKENCMLCHKVNSKMIGPALAGIADRRDEDWILQMVKNSSKLIASGDETAVQLFKDYKQRPMPSFHYLSNEEILEIVDYIMKASN